METIIGKINGVSLECTPSLPIVENVEHIYQFIWDDSNLDNTIWKSKIFSNNPYRMAYFKNSQSRQVYEQCLEKDPDDGFYKCEIPSNVLTPAGYLFISIVLTADTKKMLTAEMEKPLSILKAGAHQFTHNNEPAVRSVMEKIT